MSKRMWVVVALFAVGLAFPAAGVTKTMGGGTLNMIAWEGYTQPQWVEILFEKATGMHAERQVRRLVRRDGGADALRRRQPVRAWSRPRATPACA